MVALFTAALVSCVAVSIKVLADGAIAAESRQEGFENAEEPYTPCHQCKSFCAKHGRLVYFISKSNMGFCTSFSLHPLTCSCSRCFLSIAKPVPKYSPPLRRLGLEFELRIAQLALRPLLRRSGWRELFYCVSQR